MFTARYVPSHYITQINIFLKGLISPTEDTEGTSDYEIVNVLFSVAINLKIKNKSVLINLHGNNLWTV